MTTTRKRSRRERPAPGAAPARPTPAVQAALAPLSTWKWRTFPVYFAFSLALFIGVYVGMLAYAANDAGNTTVGLVVAGVPAVMLGLGFSRLMLRFMMTRGIIKPRTKRK
jgi:hypothetical protein